MLRSVAFISCAVGKSYQPPNKCIESHGRERFTHADGITASQGRRGHYVKERMLRSAGLITLIMKDFP